MRNLRSETLLLFSCFSLWGHFISPAFPLRLVTEATYVYEVSVSWPRGGDVWSEPGKVPEYNPQQRLFEWMLCTAYIMSRTMLKVQTGCAQRRRRLNYTHSQSSSRFTLLYLFRQKARFQLSQPPGSRKCTGLKVSGAVEGRIQTENCSVWDKRSLSLAKQWRK